MKTVLLVLAASVCGWGQPSRIVTNGNLNGRAWKGLDSSSKLVFVAAYVTAINHASTLARAMELAEKRKDTLYSKFISDAVTRTMDNTERVTALDGFYDPPENTPIEIGDALDVIAARASGEDDAAIKKRISDLLKELPK